MEDPEGRTPNHKKETAKKQLIAPEKYPQKQRTPVGTAGQTADLTSNIT